jgi:hypothetical protein
MTKPEAELGHEVDKYEHVLRPQPDSSGDQPVCHKIINSYIKFAHIYPVKE